MGRTRRQLRDFVIICSVSALLYTAKTISLGGFVFVRVRQAATLPSAPLRVKGHRLVGRHR